MRLLLLLLIAPAAAALDEEIRKDVAFPEGTHRVRRPLRVLADGITVDLRAALLVGSDEGRAPDEYDGIGLIVEGRKHVTIRGGSFRGFKCAILLKDCEDVLVEGVETSDNFRQHLGSTPEREDPADWLRPHENDEQEWRKRYGAGICLENCRYCVVRDCRGRRQQNGIVLDRCSGCEVYDNDFSFLSGWGLALWRSSSNMVARNSFDWCVRGYSHGVYDRGQDSAGILVFEQCNENVFVKNSATHSGDGFFLYAGNETVRKTGKGGCNDNLVLNNDFSHAVANAIEATFSRGNRFIGNRCDDSNYGVWAGYSYETLVEGNHFEGNTVAGVAIEHGTTNDIVFNTFTNNRRGIRLWWDDDRDLLKSAFGRKHACRSEGYRIARNTFDGGVGIHLVRTSNVTLADNHFEGVAEELKTEGGCEDVRRAKADVAGTKNDLDVPGQREPFLAADQRRGRRFIRIDEWGPLDPRRPAVFPRSVTGWGACAFHVLGDGPYRVEDLPDGLEVEKGPRTFRVRGEGSMRPFRCTVVAGGKRFPVEGVVLNARWRVRFWSWKADPREDAGAWTALLASPPLETRETPRLDFAWRSDAPSKKVPADRFATRAETVMTLPAGRYELRTVSDDGVRVKIDGKTVLEDWTWHAPKEHKAVVELDGGEHGIVVEHFEIDGWAMLRFDLRPLP